jgi:hypothetical protein
MVIEGLLSSEALLTTNIPATPYTRASLSIIGGQRRES